MAETCCGFVGACIGLPTDDGTRCAVHRRFPSLRPLRPGVFVADAGLAQDGTAYLRQALAPVIEPRSVRPFTRPWDESPHWTERHR